MFVHFAQLFQSCHWHRDTKATGAQALRLRPSTVNKQFHESPLAPTILSLMLMGEEPGGNAYSVT